MVLIITSIELKSPFGFFALSMQARQVVKQLKHTSCLSSKTTGFWTKHYTMTLWESEAEMKSFIRSGAHLKAMKNSESFSKEIKTLKIQAEKFPSWKKARHLVDKEKPYHHK